MYTCFEHAAGGLRYVPVVHEMMASCDSISSQVQRVHVRVLPCCAWQLNTYVGPRSHDLSCTCSQQV